MSDRHANINFVSSSAVHRTPVEMWMTILKHLLEDPSLFRPNPFYSGCNPHTALREWNDYPRLREILNNQRNLRAVSKSWNHLVDSIKHHYYELPIVNTSATISRIETWTNARLSTRVYLDSSRPPCSCICYCKCAGKDHEDELPIIDPTIGQTIRDTLYHPDSNVTILSLSAQVWDCIFGRPNPSDIPPLDRIKALDLFHYSAKGIDIPSICPNLIFEHTSGGIFWQLRHSPSCRVSPPIYPYTITRRRHRAFLDIIQMPRLQNLELVEYEYNSFVRSCFQGLAERIWPYLVSVKLLSYVEYIQLPPTTWEFFPALQYLGLSSVHAYVNSPPPPSHPFHTLASLDVDGDEMGNTRRPFAKLLQSWPSVKTVADSHSWSEFSPVDNKSTGDLCDHVHLEDMNCLICIQQLETYCRERSLRYEDRYGKSWEEYQASRRD